MALYPPGGGACSRDKRIVQLRAEEVAQRKFEPVGISLAVVVLPLLLRRRRQVGVMVVNTSLGITGIEASAVLGAFRLRVMSTAACLANVVALAAAAAAAVAVAAGLGGGAGSARPCCTRWPGRISVQAVVQLFSKGNEVRPRHSKREYHRGGCGRLALVLRGLGLAHRSHAIDSSPVAWS